MPQGTGAIGPHGLDVDRRFPLAFERPLHRVAGQGSKVIDVAEMDEKDRPQPARRRPNHRAGRGIIREMAGGAQDAVLQEPGIWADREQPKVVVGLQDEHVRIAGARDDLVGTPPRSVAISTLTPFPDMTKPTGSVASCGTWNASTCTLPTRNGTPVVKRSVDAPLSRSPAAASVPALASTGAPTSRERAPAPLA